MPGGFKGSHTGTWPSGPTAAAFDGQSVLVAWTEASFVDILRIGSRDIYLKRILDGWAPVDEPALRLATGPTEETGPVLASDGAGRTLLAYIRKMSDTELILGFDDHTDEIPARLKKGWNQLLVGVDNKFGAWCASAQIVDRNRQPIPDLTWQVESPFE
jgi:hypothetical protein